MIFTSHGSIFTLFLLGPSPVIESHSITFVVSLSCSKAKNLLPPSPGLVNEDLCHLAWLASALPTVV